MLSVSIRSCSAKFSNFRGLNKSNTSSRAVKERKVTTLVKPRQKLFSRSYCTTKGSNDDEEVSYEPDMTKPDYGLPDVRLDSLMYYSAFSDPKPFLRAPKETWMLWQPPKSILRPDEWAEARSSMFTERMARSGTGDRTLELVYLMQIRASALRDVEENVENAFLATVDYVNDNNLEALESSMHVSCYNYVKGWLQYLKDNGYTWKHSVESVESVKQLGTALILVTDVSSKSKPTYTETVALAKYGDGKAISDISVLHWSEITTREKFEIVDSKGSVIHTSPTRKCEHVWKFGFHSQSKHDRWQNPDDPNIEKDPNPWQFKLYDIDNQVILRASDILTQEKIFLDSDAPRDEVWRMTKAM